jgi:hypothetical protein
MTKEKECLNFTLLNIGHAIHNADWNWSNVSSPVHKAILGGRW